MRKKNIILCAGLLSMAMLCGCGEKSQKETTTDVTAEATQEATETTDETASTPEATDASTQDTEEETTTETTPVEEEVSEGTEVQEENAEDTITDSYAALSSLMTAIYGVDESSTNAETVAEELKTYAFTYGAPSSSTAYESMANDWFDTMKETEGKDIRSEFRKCFDTVTSTAASMDENLEFDVAYLNVINGISAAIGE